MFNKLLPREEQYFTLFAQMTSYINDAAKTLVEMLSQRDGDYQEYVQRIKSIEHACDDLLDLRTGEAEGDVDEDEPDGEFDQGSKIIHAPPLACGEVLIEIIVYRLSNSLAPLLLARGGLVLGAG